MNISAIIVTRGDQDLTPVLTSLPEEWELLVWNNGLRALDRFDPGERGTRWRGVVDDLAVYGRYAAIEYTAAELIYVQDDDCVVSDPEALVKAWHDANEFEVEGRVADPRGFVVCNMPAAFRARHFYDEHSLVGFGACFHRDAPDKAFRKFWGETLEEQLAMHVTMPIDEPGNPAASTSPIFPPPPPPKFFQRTCDIVFTALTPRILVDIEYEDMPWASADNRMWKQPWHQQIRDQMLKLVQEVRDAS